ncbi:MAG: pyridoxal phosphate-dependent aminotransferase [Acidobacteria bacterium]|nr:pyridoxal phosphate-dependent aminotransferase [Acidobacteriota bacterium]
MLFSSRFRWELRPNRLAQLLESKRKAGASILDLTESNPTRAGFSYPETEILAALADTRSLRYDPSPQGLLSAREAVAGYYGRRGQKIEPERIFLTASTSEAYSYLFKLLADPGEEVLAPRPSYPLFEFLAGLEAVRTRQYPLAYEHGWAIDLEALARSISLRTRAVVLVNPNNPTGSFLKKQEFETLISVCAEHELAIISDEVFSDYFFAPDENRVQTLAGVEQVATFCLSGLSKVAGLPQMKLGWIVLGGPPGIRAQARERLELIADTYLSVGTPVQQALPRLLALGETVREQIRERVRANLDFLRGIMQGSACRMLDVEGGWYATLQAPRTRSEEQWCLELLEEENVLVQPGFFYDFDSEAYLVVSLLTPPERLKEGVRRVLLRIGKG